MNDGAAKLIEFIDTATNILLVSHRKPDADTIGAASFLKEYLKGIGKRSVLACVDKPSPVFSFMPNVDQYVSEFDIAEFDLMIVLDAGASYMTNFHLKYENFFNSAAKIVNIDHHASNDFFGDLNIVDSDAASTTVVLYRIFKGLEIDFSADMATCLLAGIYGDTGAFMHSNTSAEVYVIAADLMNKGARVSEISQALFRNNNVSTLRLWGRALEKVNITDDGVVMSVLSENDYMEVGANPEQASGVIDYLNMVPDTKFAVLVNEDNKGNVKGSLRARASDIDVSRIAAVFGGGGHAKASGFSIPGKLTQEIRYTIVSEDMSKKSLDF